MRESLLLLLVASVYACVSPCGPFADTSSTACIGVACQTQCTCHPGTGFVTDVICNGVDEWVGDNALHRCRIDNPSVCVPVSLPADWASLACPYERNATTQHCICPDGVRGWRCLVETCHNGCSGDPCDASHGVCECREGRTGCSCEIAPPSPQTTKNIIIIQITDNSTYTEIQEAQQTNSVMYIVIFVVASAVAVGVTVYLFVAL